MDFVERLERTAFHDATISAIRMENGHLHLEFENVIVDVDSDDYYRAILDLGGVHDITRGGDAVDTLNLEGEDSSVLAFERHGQTASLVVVWRFYSTRTDETQRYEFAFNTFSLRGEKQASCL